MTIQKKLIFCLLSFHIICLAQKFPSAETLIKDLACISCHDGINIETDIKNKAPDLSRAGLRLHPDHLFTFLYSPTTVKQSIGYSRMPNFHLDEQERLALTLYLEKLTPSKSGRPDYPLPLAYEKAKAKYPEIDAQMGEAIFYSQNCTGCHIQSSAILWENKNGPDLSFQGDRVNEKWLRSFLRKSKPIRPFGYYPGSGSRHPDFRLTKSEVDTLTHFLLNQKKESNFFSLSYSPKVLTPFLMDKAKKLLVEKLPCLGCHRLGNDGGRIAPDLSSIKDRLKPEYVYQIIKDPKSIMDETNMPKIPMSQENLNLIVNYLVQQKLPKNDSAYLSLIDNPLLGQTKGENGQKTYLKYCSSCHGINGDGDGYNRKYLPISPTRHSDKIYMAKRPDDTLFDGIYVGGYILDKSHRMPAWGLTLEREEIRELVAYLRDLCECRGPLWSRDN